MSQAKMLPEQIVANLFAPHDGNTVKFNKETTEKLIREYAYETTVVAIILSDNYMKPLYKACGQGYMSCLDIINEWAIEFVKLYGHVEEWEEFCDTQAIYKNIMCWDDFVIAFGADKLKKDFRA